MKKFVYNKKNKILICIHDIIDRYQSNTAIEVSKNLTDYMISRLVKRNFDIFIGKDEDEMLISASEESFYSHAVIVACGTSMRLSDRLLDEIISKCEEDFFVAGHILDRDEKYFELHHQFYIVNLKHYCELNLPEIGQESLADHEQIEPFKSEETAGDSYIPKFILNGKISKSYSSKMHGWNIISEGLKSNRPIIDVGDGIRETKKYLYYEYDPVFVTESSHLFYNQFLMNNIVVPFNSDGINQTIDFKGPVEQYVSVGTGLNWVKNLEILGYTENTEVIFTDINPLVLIFMKKLITHWDGENYLEFYRQNQENDLPNNLPYSYDRYMKHCIIHWGDLLSRFDDWKQSWKAITKLKFKFVSLDYMSNFNLDWLEKSKKTFFNMSDVFNHVPNIFCSNVKYRISAENRFLDKVKKFDENIMIKFTGRAAEGFSDDLLYYGSAKEFDYTDINQLSRIPDWHQKDWQSYKILM